MRKSYGCEHFKIPSVLEDPYDNKQQKVSNMVFSFPYRDKHFAQKGQLPYQPSVCTKLQHMLISQIWQWRKEMHDAALSISGCCRGRKGQSLYNPKSSHTIREHQWVALTSFWLRGVWSKLRDLCWMQHFTEAPGSLLCVAAQWRGLAPFPVFVG